MMDKAKRKPRGKPFEKGNQFGGDSTAGLKEQFRQQLLRSFTPEKRQRLIDVLERAALDSDSWAMTYLMDRLMGKERDGLDVTGSLSVSSLISAVRTACESPEA